ncbi:SHOCT domain-containing protein [Mucilaginibacter flavidus]|uniref:SHOCT domain-containing protein n=1 Tax=Mucilaginibacter flavidus TaxID=2949309 RepID=UPI002093C24A|nr:SHOCT domain-containing protein [Mucilaginibacter flavidus]MCO5948066.1 SHOCT domain-containing protein [Mucilaginibacter flavidus]
MKALLFIILLSPIVCYGQILGFGKKLNEYKASNGKTYHIGDTIKLGRGSAPNGDFRYIQMGGWALLSNDKGSDSRNTLKSASGRGAFIKKIHSSKAHGFQQVIFAVSLGYGTNFDLFIEDAIATCEIVDCKPVNVNVVNQQSGDNLDKIKKLKSLLDSGAITQAEYDAQKKKLLAE